MSQLILVSEVEILQNTSSNGQEVPRDAIPKCWVLIAKDLAAQGYLRQASSPALAKAPERTPKGVADYHDAVPGSHNPSRSQLSNSLYKAVPLEYGHVR